MVNIKLKTNHGAAATGTCVYNPKFPRRSQVTIKAGSLLTIDPYAKGVASNIQQNYDAAAKAHKSGALKKTSDGVYEVVKDITGLSVAGSGVMVTGKPGRGWDKWIMDDGRPLDDLRSLTVTTTKSESPDPKAAAPTCIRSEGNDGRRLELPRSLKECECDADLCKDLACRFIEKLRSRSHAGVDLSKVTGWFDGAYTASAGQKNPPGSILRISPQAKIQIETIVTTLFVKLAHETNCGQSRFDYLFREAIHQIEATVATNSPATTFSFGRAQKVLNIIVKYCYVWWLCKKTFSPMFGDVSWIEKWKPYLHVPVDRKTMEHLSQTHRDLVYSGNSLISWKWRMTEYCYFGIQDAIRVLAYAANLDPICYEMKYIWTV
jgi:hypothetical protein